MAEKNITVIIPVHSAEDAVIKKLKKANESVPSTVETYIVTDKSILDDVIKKSGLVVNPIDCDGAEKSEQFCLLVNQAVKNVTTEWFSILEYDDVYSKTWFDNVEQYIKYNPGTSVFLPLVDLFNERGQFIGNGNEAPWASSFSDQIGFIDHGCLKYYMDFYPTGGVFNKADWEEVGGLKPLMKLTYWYELMMRMTDKGKVVQVIPKMGYVHTLNNEGSISLDYNTNLTNDERAFWVELAREDFHFKSQRDPSKYVFDPSNFEASEDDGSEEPSQDSTTAVNVPLNPNMEIPT